MIGSYRTTTLAAARQAVAARLSDSGMVHWVSSELDLYLLEALRTWGSVTRSFRAMGVFPTAASTTFYDLATVLPALRGMTVTDQDLISAIEYALLEPQGLTAWAGSAQFTLADVTAAIQRRRDQFLLETGAVLTHQTIPIAPPPDGRILFDEAIATIRRVAWIAVDGTVSPLIRDDEWSMRAYAPSWVQRPALVPEVYSVGVTPPLVLQLTPPQVVSGALDVVSVNRGALLDPTVGVALGIPNDWAWVVKFGALADLLGQDGLAFDPLRAAYCESRWRQGIQLATASSVVLTARVGNITCAINSVSDADRYLSAWQTTTGAPEQVLLAGHNLVALAPTPDGVPVGGQYGVALDVIRNTPVPVYQTDFLQVGPEVVEAILDYAQHLALFKEGAGPLDQASAFLDRFLRSAGVTTAIRRASTPSQDALEGQTGQDERTVARTQSSETSFSGVR